MEFDNSFEVPLPPETAWKVLMDVEKIAPCMPGAELTEIIDPKSFKGKVAVRLGPVALTFVGTARFEEIDEANRKARVKAQGSDNKGRGGANAVVDFRLEPVPQGSKVLVHTALNLSGSVAQYGRGAGMIQAVAGELIGQFATALRAQVVASNPAPASAPQPSAAEPGPAPAIAGAAPSETPVRPAAVAPPQAAKPISGFSLLARVLWQAILGLFKGRRQES